MGCLSLHTFSLTILLFSQLSGVGRAGGIGTRWLIFLNLVYFALALHSSLSLFYTPSPPCVMVFFLR